MPRRTEIQGRPAKSTPKKSHAIKVRKSKPKTEPEPAPVRTGVSTGEIVNVVGDTFERIYAEFGQYLNRPSAEDFGLQVAKYLRHGITGEGTEPPPKLRERTLKVPLCKKCEG